MLVNARIGLIVGIIGLTLNGLVSGFSGITGPIIALAVGILSGLIVVLRTKPSSKKEGARGGALAGGASGCVVILGQIINAIVAVISIFSAESVISKIYTALVTTGFALGLGCTIALLAAGLGAGVGYLLTHQSTSIDALS